MAEGIVLTSRKNLHYFEIVGEKHKKHNRKVTLTGICKECIVSVIPVVSLQITGQTLLCNDGSGVKNSRPDGRWKITGMWVFFVLVVCVCVCVCNTQTVTDGSFTLEKNLTQSALPHGLLHYQWVIYISALHLNAEHSI